MTDEIIDPETNPDDGIGLVQDENNLEGGSV